MTTPDGPLVDAVVADLNRLWDRLALPPLALKTESVGRFQQGLKYPDWCALPGIYIFSDYGRVQFIGRALRTTLGERLKSQCNSFGDPKWDAIIRSPSAEVLAAPLAADDWYFAASLEAALIATHRPPRSKRIS